MEDKTNKYWFHAEDILKGKVDLQYKGVHAPYFDSNMYLWCNFLSENYKVILNEFEMYIKHKKIKPYFYAAQSENSKKWKTLPLITWNIRRKNLQYFRLTKNTLDKIPGLVSASFSLLEAGGKIIEHKGDTDAHIRAHLCLYTSSDFHQAEFTVNGISRHWENGKCLLFCDAYLHNGSNNSNENRLVMILDILHPENIKNKKEICSKVWSGLIINYLYVLLNLKKITSFYRVLFKMIYTIAQYTFRILMFFKIKL